MNTASVLKAIAKTGTKVTQEGRRYSANNGKNVIEFIDQDSHAICLHVQGSHEQSDPMTDYFPGSFAGSIKQAINWFTA